MFKLGEEVMSKKLGVMATCKIVGIVDGRIWGNLHMDDPGTISAFDRVYPEWTKKHVYYVEFPSEVKPLSLEQYTEEQENGNCYCEMAYEELDLGRIFVYPEEDLEKFEFEW